MNDDARLTRELRAARCSRGARGGCALRRRAARSARSRAEPRAGAEPTAAQIAAALPLDTLGLEHIGTVVPDVTRAAQFFSRVFNPVLYKERDEPLRYYVTLDPGYIALGSRANDAARVHRPRLRAAEQLRPRGHGRRLEARRLAGRALRHHSATPTASACSSSACPAASPARRSRPDGSSTASRSCGRAGSPTSCATSRTSSARRRSTADSSAREPRTDAGGVAFRAAHTRWILRPRAGRRSAAHRPLRRQRRALRPAAVVRGLEALGARIVSAAPERLHFRCPDGLGVELVPVDPARIWGLA